jgi:hypothetical protein
MLKRFARTLAVSAILAGLGLTVPSTAPAQAKFELTPFFASYYALLTMTDDANGDGSNVKIQQTAAPSVGGRLTYWISNTIGVEASGSYSRSGIRAFVNDTSTLGGLSFSLKGTMTAASARLLYRPARTNLHFIVGGGIMHRGGDFWKSSHDNFGVKVTSPTGVLGMGVRAAVTPQFALNVSVEANLYSLDLDGSDPTNGSKLQSDVLVAIGVPITLSR